MLESSPLHYIKKKRKEGILIQQESSLTSILVRNVQPSQTSSNNSKLNEGRECHSPSPLSLSGLLDGACCAVKLEDVPAKFLLSGCFRLNDVSVVHACETAPFNGGVLPKPPPNTQPSNHPRCCSPKRRKLGRGIATRTRRCGRWRERERERRVAVSSWKLPSTMGKILSWRETSESVVR